MNSSVSVVKYLIPLLFLTACRAESPWPPGVQTVSDEAPVLSPEEALGSFFLPPDYGIELVAAEPMVEAPVAIDFDPEGRMWVVEMRSFMPNLDGEGEDVPSGRIVVLEDLDGDGRMDRRSVYLDSLVLPRAVKVLDDGVLVAAPPFLWLTRDLNGDLRADTREVVRTDYGNPDINPEHNANGLLWGMDNWIHSSKYPRQQRRTDGRWQFRDAIESGQWGVSTDDFGRLYRNYNEDPLHVDLLDAHYLARNPNLNRTRGVYEATDADAVVWPVRPTPGVNRGYREQVLREDGTLHRFTAAGSPVVYRGDRLPGELRNNVFVTEPAGNLVRRYIVTDQAGDSHLARNPYASERAEFLASTDERFRPVNLFSAPDGTLYVVDMYRGIIQHRQYVTGYLEEQIRRRGLEQPLHLGRIYRIVHRTTQRDRRPDLASRTPLQLVEYLEHPNGWWRSMAQQLIVERGDASAAPALRSLAGDGADERARLHALWALEGLGMADVATLDRALNDASHHVRAAAVRISEPLLAELAPAVIAAADDPHPAVRRQAAATLGALPTGATHGSLPTAATLGSLPTAATLGALPSTATLGALPSTATLGGLPAAARNTVHSAAPGVPREDVLLGVLLRHGSDPITVDAALSGLEGLELHVLEQLLEATRDTTGSRDAVEQLAAAAMQGGARLVPGSEREAAERLLRWFGDPARPEWQRRALVRGLDIHLPRAQDGQVQRLRLAGRPEALIAAAEAGGETGALAESVAWRLDWPGKPAPPSAEGVRPLTAAEGRRLEAGRGLYGTHCAVCHRPDGSGMPGVAKPLVGSPFVLGRPERLIRIILHGKEGEMMMPPLGSLGDDEIAAIATFVRRSWGHQASPVAPADVNEQRGQTAGRNRPWTEEEL